MVREAGDGIPPLPGDVHSPLSPRAPVLRRLLGTRGGPARDVLFPHRDVGLSLVRVQPPFRRGPVPQGANLVVPRLGARRSPALPPGDHALPLRRARARPLVGSVGRSRPALGRRLRRVARPHGHRDSLHASPAAPGLGTSGPWRGEDQARVVANPSQHRVPGATGKGTAARARFYSEASQRRSLRTGPSFSALDGLSPSLKTTPRRPGIPLGKSSARPACTACAAAP